MKEYLQSLGITEEGKMSSDGTYVIDIPDSMTYGKYFSKLDKAEDLEELEDSSTLTLNNSNIVFTSVNYYISLIANFDDDTYRLVVKETI